MGSKKLKGLDYIGLVTLIKKINTLLNGGNMNKITRAIIAGLGGALLSSAVSAAPLLSSTSLPLTGDDLIQASNYFTSEAELQQFAKFVKGLDVFPDHKNPTSIAQMENKQIKKQYYIPPYFQAPRDQQVAGAVEIADYALKLMAGVQTTARSFNFNLVEYTARQQEIQRYEKSLIAFEKMYEKAIENSEISKAEIIKQAIVELKQQIAGLKDQQQQGQQQGQQGLEEMYDTLRQEVANQVRMDLAMLGVQATSEELSLFNSNESQKILQAMTSMMARANAEGQFGVQQGVFTQGYNQKEMEYIRVYRLIRNDVKVSALSTTAVYAKAAALTSRVDASEDDPLTNSSGVANAPRFYLAVNGGSNGRCGNTRSCNVVIDLTSQGAYSALAKTGAKIFPVVFEADVKFKQPDFDGTLTCDFKTGWQAEGRADVKDGGVIYDGDVYNRIKYSSLEDGGCDYQIRQGDKDSAAFHTINYLYKNYMQLKNQRAIKSKEEKDRYQQYVTSEVQRHANMSQQDNGWEWYSLTTWTRAFGRGWGTAVSFVVGAARNFYWHTRIEDTSNYDRVKFSTTIKEFNTVQNVRFTFDANPTLCWKSEGFGNKFLSACPSAEYDDKADTDLGRTQQTCQDQSFTTDCTDQIEQNEQNQTTDENGVIQDPWA